MADGKATSPVCLLAVLLVCACSRVTSESGGDASAVPAQSADRTPRECGAQPCMTAPDGRVIAAGEAIELWKKSGRTPPWEQDAAARPR